MNKITKKYFSVLALVVSLILSGCGYYETEETEILQIVDYISYDKSCVDMIVKTENGQIKNVFVNEENIYFHNGEDMVVAIHHVKYNSTERFRYDTEFYLYLNEDKLNKYIKKYTI